MKKQTDSQIAKKERDEIIKNAESAYRRGEISAAFLAWYRRFTAKELLRMKTK
jgi:hypothetical protein